MSWEIADNIKHVQNNTSSYVKLETEINFQNPNLVPVKLTLQFKILRKNVCYYLLISF